MNSLIPKIDIRPDHWEIVRDILHKHVPDYEVWAFGSRAKWTAKNYSDLDLAVITAKPLSLDVSANLSDDFSESDLPWKVDIVDWAVTQDHFREIIKRDKVVVQKAKGLVMSFDWPKVKLGSYCKKIGSGATPRGGASVYMDQGEICLIRSQNVYNEGLNPNGLVYIDEDAAKKLNNVTVEENDILLNITGDSVARVCLAKSSFLPARVNQHVAIIRSDEDEFDPRFIRYLLASPAYQNILLSIAAVGATRNALTKGMIENLDVLKPPIEQQIEMANQLEALDKKIDINSETNQTLEQIAQAIFKSWFVDFDPVKAKIETLAAGGSVDDAELAAMSVISAKTLDELNSLKASNPEAFNKLAQTAALFPAAMQDSELGEIPEGWSVKPINALCTKVQNGGTPKRSESLFWEEGNIPWLTSGEVRQSIITTVENRITQLGLEKSSAKWVPELSTLVALYGATAGEVSLTSIPLTTNQAVCALIPKKEHQWFNYLQLNSRVAELAGKAVGSAQQNISKGLVESTKVLSVPESLLVVFNYQVDNLFKLRFSNLRQNFELATLRDTILPKLLSGEIDLTSEVVA